jgi:hypothetical protein
MMLNSSARFVMVDARECAMLNYVGKAWARENGGMLLIY